MASTGVSFIRVHGRVVPIRAGDERKMEKAQGYLNKAAISSATGLGISTVLTRSNKRPNLNVPKFAATYGKELKQAGYPHILQTKTFGSSATNISGKPPTIWLAKGAGESSALHELGHIVASKKAYTMNNMYRKIFTSAGKDVAAGKKGLGAAKMLAFNAIRPFANIPAELEASGHAIAFATRAKGLKTGLKIGAKLALPFGTYAAGAATIGFLGAGLATMATIKGPRKNKHGK